MTLTSGVLVPAVSPVPASAQGVPAPAWGASVEGLGLGLALVDGAEREPVIEVTFENAGSQTPCSISASWWGTAVRWFLTPCR